MLFATDENIAEFCDMASTIARISNGAASEVIEMFMLILLGLLSEERVNILWSVKNETPTG